MKYVLSILSIVFVSFSVQARPTPAQCLKMAPEEFSAFSSLQKSASAKLIKINALITPEEKAEWIAACRAAEGEIKIEGRTVHSSGEAMDIRETIMEKIGEKLKANGIAEVEIGSFGKRKSTTITLETYNNPDQYGSLERVIVWLSHWPDNNGNFYLYSMVARRKDYRTDEDKAKEGYRREHGFGDDMQIFQVGRRKTRVDYELSGSNKDTEMYYFGSAHKDELFQVKNLEKVRCK